LTGSLRVQADVHLDQSAIGRVTVVALDPETHQPVAQAIAAVTGAAPTALVELHIAEPKLWSPASPALYTLRASLHVSGSAAAAQAEGRDRSSV
jgi:beta-galactosidase/beta-glucuronidase